MTRREPLRDGHGRRIADLRVSVTDRCNFRCQYCMPADGLPWLEREEILSFEEIERLVRAVRLARLDDVRLTGGEPLVRREFPRWSRCWRRSTGSSDLSLTTNGYLLERDAAALVAAGIDRVNVSIDSLQRDRFFEITRRDALATGAARPRRDRRLPAGAARSRSTRSPMRGFTERGGAALRELRPPSAPSRSASSSSCRSTATAPGAPTSADRRGDAGDDRRAVHPLEALPREPHATARVSASATGAGEIGFINPVSRAVLRRLQPHPPDRRREAAHLPVLPPRDRPARAAARRAPTTPSWSGSSATRSGARS